MTEKSCPLLTSVASQLEVRGISKLKERNWRISINPLNHSGPYSDYTYQLFQNQRRENFLLKLGIFYKGLGHVTRRLKIFKDTLRTHLVHRFRHRKCVYHVCNSASFSLGGKCELVRDHKFWSLQVAYSHLWGEIWWHKIFQVIKAQKRIRHLLWHCGRQLSIERLIQHTCKLKKVLKGKMRSDHKETK